MDMIKIFKKWLQAFNNQAVMWEDPDLAGYLEKRGGKRTNWKQRFFLLQGSTLFYFPSPTYVAIPLGVLPLEGSDVNIAGHDEGGPQRKWCFRIRLRGLFFDDAKRSVYLLSALSKQARDEWVENLKYAATARGDLIDNLRSTRRIGADLRFKLANSPTNLHVLANASLGREGRTLQSRVVQIMETEIDRVQDKLSDVQQKLTRTRLGRLKLEANVMLSLASVDFYARYLSGANMSKFKKQIHDELKLTEELYELMKKKASYIQGQGLEKLAEDARIELYKICEKALLRDEEYQAKVRIKAPRYTTEVNTHVFSDHDAQFKHTSDIYNICLKSATNKKLLSLRRRYNFEKTTEEEDE